MSSRTDVIQVWVKEIFMDEPSRGLQETLILPSACLSLPFSLLRLSLSPCYSHHLHLSLCLSLLLSSYFLSLLDSISLLSCLLLLSVLLALSASTLQGSVPHPTHSCSREGRGDRSGTGNTVSLPFCLPPPSFCHLSIFGFLGMSMESF